MNRSLLRSAVCTMLALFAFGGCTLFPRKPATIAGSWKNTLGTVWTLSPDGTFTVDINHDGKRDAWGHYAVNGNIITIAGTQGRVPKFCDRPGVYSFELKSDRLNFTPIKDKCRLRARYVLLAWHRV
jgi:hypothetical protein